MRDLETMGVIMSYDRDHELDHDYAGQAAFERYERTHPAQFHGDGDPVDTEYRGEAVYRDQEGDGDLEGLKKCSQCGLTEDESRFSVDYADEDNICDKCWELIPYD